MAIQSSLKINQVDCFAIAEPAPRVERVPKTLVPLAGQALLWVRNDEKVYFSEVP